MVVVVVTNIPISVIDSNAHFLSLYTYIYQMINTRRHVQYEFQTFIYRKNAVVVHVKTDEKSFNKKINRRPKTVKTNGGRGQVFYNNRHGYWTRREKNRSQSVLNKGGPILYVDYYRQFSLYRYYLIGVFDNSTRYFFV